MRRANPFVVRAAHGLVLLAFLALAAPAVASPNDFRFNARGADGRGIFFDENLAPRTDLFERFTTELAYVLGPRGMGPAETLGHAGFGVGITWSGSFVSNSEPYWQATERVSRLGEPAPAMLSTLGLELRKGLPLSLELGMSLAWLVESGMVAPSLDVRWALLEGFEAAPELAVRGALTHLLGGRDLNLTTISVDGTLSKGFGVGGLAHIAPYLGWTALMVAASTRVIDPTPEDSADVERNFVFPDLSPTDNLHHRLTLGVRVLVSFVTVGVQGDWEVLKKTPTGTDFFGSVGSVRVKLGLEY